MAGYSKTEFLRAVLPPEQNSQYYCSVFIGRSDTASSINRTIQRFHHSIAELVQSVENPPVGVWNTYYLVATSKAESRKRESITQHRAFFLDIDLKEYKTKQDALAALVQFYDHLELPAPTLVDSGNGLHAYWTIEKPIPSLEWRRVADHLKQLCIDSKLYADPSVTADPSRILRMPGTLNVKDHLDPKQAACKALNPPLDYDLFKALIGYVERDTFDELEQKFSTGMDAVSQNILGTGLHKEFQHGLMLSLQGLGCAYLKYAYEQQAAMTEPQWRSALSIAQHCSDRAKGIHAISKRYPGYSKEETERKAALITGPHTCDTFRDVFSSIPQPIGRASHCDACPRKKELKSPIMLCVTQQVATAEETVITTVDADTGHEIEIQVPVDTYPKPYYGLKGGGVFKRVRVDDEDAENADEATLQDLQGKKIYEYHIWVDSLQVDPIVGELVVIMLKQPRQDLVRFSIPFNKVTALSEFTEIVSTHGVSTPNYKELMEYIKAFVTKLQKDGQKTQCPASFGWERDYSSFVLGPRRYLSSGEVEYCLPSEAMQEAAMLYGLKNLKDVPGHNDDVKIQHMLDTWKGIFSLYTRPGHEARAFTVFVSMGSPLFVFFNNIHGLILHLTNKASGVGKSTVQHMATSVWGVPDNQTLMNLSDTKLSIIQRLGVLRHVVMCIDELTTVEAEKMCQFVFDISSGRGRHRMEASSNRMRQNVTEWRTPVITSGNNGLHQLMTKFKMVADGEAMRTMELEITRDESMSTAEGKALTDKLFSDDLMTCYGVVGDRLLRYYVTHAEECKALLMATRQRFDAAANISQRERFYSALCAEALTAAEISKRIGIHDMDMDHLFNWTVEMCVGATEAASRARISMLDQFKDFLHEMQPHTVVTTTVHNKLSVLQEPMYSQVAHVRYLLNIKKGYICSRKLKDWCTDKAISYNDMISMIVKEMNGKIAASRIGAKSTAPPVRCVIFDTGGADLGLDVDPAN